MDEQYRRLAEENAALKARVAELEGKLSAAPKAGGPKTILGLSDLVIQMDENLVVSYINSATEEHLQRSRKEVIGKGLQEIRGPGLDPEMLVELSKKAIATGRAEEETQYKHPRSGKAHFLKITASASAGSVQILIEDQSRLKVIEKSFKRYVSPKVIEKIIELNADPFTAQKYILTVLFADLRGFTSMSSGLKPEEVKEIIDEYLSEMIRVIIHNDATVDKIVGDEVMALFGAPVPYEDHAVRAVNCALKMQAAHKGLMESWKSRGKPAPAVGIGINTGEMVVGNIGSEQLMNYTVLGHHVNLAARLCSAAPGGDIIMSMFTFNECKKYLQANPNVIEGHVKFRRGETVKAKGIPEPVETVSVQIVE
jgi:class 3 adenylate cyclase